jgi:hypothetical protein
MKRLHMTMTEVSDAIVATVKTKNPEACEPGIHVTTTIVVTRYGENYAVVTFGTPEEIAADTRDRKAAALARGDTWREGSE